jgi:FlaG/FlaF family flagellin (archaellin)
LISNNVKILIINFAGLYKEVDKKDKSIRRNCQAVSEAIGEVLMIAVVVIAFSSIAVTIFSDIATKSPHIPHADFETTRLDSNTVRIFHVGGESINSTDMEIFVNNIPSPEVKIRNSYGEESTNSVFSLGDYIEIDTKITEYLGSSDLIDLCIVHIPSKQIILKVQLKDETILN